MHEHAPLPDLRYEFDQPQVGPEEIGNKALKLVEVNAPLTAFELIELEAASRGLTTNEAAKDRWVTPDAVRELRNKVLKKLNTHSMAAAVRESIERDILQIDKKERPDWLVLTPAELEVLELASLGKSNEASAEARNCSITTVKMHRKSIHRKLEVGTIAGAVRLGFEYGFLQPRPVGR